jgi:hypothetical protein
MSLTDFHRFKELARQENVVFFYTGYFSQSIVTAMGDSLRLRLASLDASQTARRKLFSVFVEMAQNVVHYSADHLSASNAADHEIRMGSCGWAKPTASFTWSAPTPSPRKGWSTSAPSWNRCAP